MVLLSPFFYLFVEICLFLPLYLLGLVAFPMAYHFANLVLVESRVNKGQYIVTFKNRVLNEWLGNHEDGLLPSWWVKERQGMAYGWFVRNPVSNMRFWPYVSTLPSPGTKWIGTLDRVTDKETGWFIAWHGIYAGWFWQTKKFGCWLGWKVVPRDANMNNASRQPTTDYRYYGLGTACMFWRVK